MTAYHDLIRLVRTARGLEAGGFYNAAKVLWALLYSEEIKASNENSIPRGAELDAELGEIVESLKTSGSNAALIEALEKGRAAVREDRTIPYSDIPDVAVSRTTGEIFLGQPPEFTAANDHRLGLRAFPAIWYLDPMTPAAVLTALSEGPDHVEAQLQGLSAQQMEQTPAPGEWSIRELLGHLLMAQELLATRAEKLLSQENPELAGVPVWAMEQKPLSPAEIMERYRASREHVITRLKAIPFEDWWRAGSHGEWGRVTLLDQATYFACHELSHMPQFSQIRNAVGG